jgi:hydroxypyruvate isomerase
VKALIFGSPKNRSFDPKHMTHEVARTVAVKFFSDPAEYAHKHHTTLGLEPNPAIYGTNFLNTTLETADFVREVNRPGLRLNLDVGAVELGGENLRGLWPHVSSWIGHMHWSRPHLAPVSEGSPQTAQELNKLFTGSGSLSLEMKPAADTSAADFVKENILFARSILNA